MTCWTSFFLTTTAQSSSSSGGVRCLRNCGGRRSSTAGEQRESPKLARSTGQITGPCSSHLDPSDHAESHETVAVAVDGRRLDDHRCSLLSQLPWICPCCYPLTSRGDGRKRGTTQITTQQNISVSQGGTGDNHGNNIDVRSFVTTTTLPQDQRHLIVSILSAAHGFKTGRMRHF